MATALNEPDRPRDDLSRLNDAERRVLRLLAEGHTAKSIANAIGCSPAAVNERLREARRKTGVGSSRELARLLKAQENRDNLIGVAGRRRFNALFSQSAAEPWRPQTGAIGMSALFLVTAAGAAVIFMQAAPVTPQEQPSPQTISDPDLGTFLEGGPAWLYPMIRKESRDPNWALRAEEALRHRYASVQFFGAKPTVLRVMCRTKTCEVAVSIADIKANSSYGAEEASIVEDMRAKGLIQTGAIVSGDTKSNRGVYLAYYLRAKR